MDSNTLVEKQIESGQKLIEDLPQRGFEVSAAYWLKFSEDGKWRFYLVSPVVDAEGRNKAAIQLHPLIWTMPQPFWINPLAIKLVGPSNPIAQDVLAILDQAHGQRVSPVIWRGNTLGHKVVEDAYLYALPVPAT